MKKEPKVKRERPIAEDWETLNSLMKENDLATRRLAAAMNEELQKVGITEKINARNFAQVLTGKSRGLYLTEALALSKVYKTDILHFLKPEYADMGEFVGTSKLPGKSTKNSKRNSK